METSERIHLKAKAYIDESGVYEAVPAKRFARQRDELQALEAAAKQLRRSELRVTTRDSRERLEEQLIEGLAVKLDEYAQEHAITDLELVSDTIDDHVAELYRRKLSEIQNTQDRRIVKAFDVPAKEQRTGVVSISFTNLSLDPRLTDLSVLPTPDPIMLLTDMLVNSLRKHLARSNADVDPLNAPASIEGWALAANVWGVSDDDFGDLM